jgi:uncharacterized protein YpuA (DUF1002 family)
MRKFINMSGTGSFPGSRIKPEEKSRMQSGRHSAGPAGAFPVLLLTVLLALTPVCPALAEGQSASAEISGSASTEAAGMDDEKVGKLFDFLKQKSDAGELETDDQIRSAIDEGSSQLGIEISDDQKKEILQAFQTLRGMGLSTDQIVEQARQFVEKYGVENFKGTGKDIEKAVQSAVKETAKDTGRQIRSNILQMFRNLGKSLLSSLQELIQKITGGS